MRRPRLLALLAACAASILGALHPAPTAAADAAARSGTLLTTVSGLPTGQSGEVSIRRSGARRAVRLRRAMRLRPGRYTLTVRAVTLTKAGGGVRVGAVAYPRRHRTRVRVVSGRTVRATVGYAGIVNPTVRPLPRRVLGVRGDPNDPTALVLPRRVKTAIRGTIFTTGPTAQLPHGLVSRVVAVQRHGNTNVVTVEPVPVGDAVPSIEYAGSLPLSAAPGAPAETEASAAGARAARSEPCAPPNLLKFKAHLDSMEIREASWNVWQGQMRLTAAVRTTASLGVALAAAGINCDWTLRELGPFQSAVPVGPIVVPVFATFPVRAGIHVNGRLEAGTVNIASTTVATVKAGRETGASLSQQGTNVWLTGTPALAGSARLYATIGVQAGIGVARGLNVNLQADFGPQLTWAIGEPCKVVMKMGSLSAGLRVLGRDLRTPAFSPWALDLWSGCSPAAPAPAAGGDGQAQPPGAGTPQPGQPQPGQPQPQPQPQPACHGGGGTSAGGPGRAGYHIEDIYLGGTWARTDPCEGTWHAKGNRPANGAYWYGNGLGVGVDCARTGAAYTVRWGDGRTETWDTWFHVTDGKWFPSAAAKETTANGFYGLPAC